MSCWSIVYIYIWIWSRQLTTDQLPHWPFLHDMCCLDEFYIKSVKLLSGKIYSEEENSSWDTSFVFKIWYREILAANRESELWDPFQLYQFFSDSFSNVSFPVERKWKSAQSVTLSSHQHRMSPIIPPLSCWHLALWWYLPFFHAS